MRKPPNTQEAEIIEDETAPMPADVSKKIFPIVGIGASAGGLSAYSKLLKALPVDTGMAFVLVQHLDPKHVSMLPELLGRTTQMPVIEIKDNMLVETNKVYVMPPNHSLAILHGKLHLMPRPDALGKHLPIDDFMRTLADDMQNNAIGVILSGTASDGTFGLRAIKAGGGITFAQNEASCEYDGMPHSAIAAGHVDFVLTPGEIAHELARIAKHPFLSERRMPKEGEGTQGSDSLNKIFVLLRSRTGNDFTFYKHATIRRRIRLRMVLNQIEHMEDYVKYLQTQPKELDVLFQDLLINVTSFFRDPETFEALKTEVFPQLMQGRDHAHPLRIWIAGCSTGEEVYSVAIALFEYLGENISGTRIQIFASDIDSKAVDKARAGHYPEGIRDDVTPARLQRYFVKTAEGYQICKSIRDICVFAVQNVVKDPPFSRLDLVCCRNLMIYLGAVLQKKVLHTFHYALSPGGFLMLGTAETIGSYADLFSMVDKKSKIYLKKSVATRLAYDFSATPYLAPAAGAEQAEQGRQSPALNLQQEAENVILANYGPPGVIVNHELQILNFRGQTGPYIEPAAGSASLNLLKMARQDLVLELRTVVREAMKEHHPVRKDGVRIQLQDGAYRLVNLRVFPLAISHTAELYYLVLFETANVPVVAETAKKGGKVGSKNADIADIPDPRDLRINELEQELLSKREYMQSVIGSQEATNEELQSANEEIQSSNEEFQSTNEELETAKEELQSTNEELATINDEHEIRNLELINANNDLSNLLVSVELAIIILSEDLSIRRFTPAARILLNLIDADVGRPMSHIRPNVTIPELESRVQQVISSMVPQSVEVQDKDGHWYVLRIRPYKTLDNRIEGVVMTFIDIDNVKDAEEQLRTALQQERRLAAVVRDSGDAVTVQDFSGRILAWNRRAAEIYGYSEEEALQLNNRVLIAERSLDEMAKMVLQLKQGIQVPPFESWRRCKDGREFKVLLTVSKLLDEASGMPTAIACTESEML